jgi:hypothetical protein
VGGINKAHNLTYGPSIQRRKEGYSILNRITIEEGNIC